MKILRKTVLFISALTVLVMALTGCMKTNSNVKFNWNGNVDYKVDYKIQYSSFGEGEEGVQYAKQYLEGLKSAVDESGFKADYKDTSDKEYAGLEFTIHFKSAEEMNKSTITEIIQVMPAPIVGNGKDSTVKLYSGDHFLFKTYQLKGVVTSKDMMNFVTYLGIAPEQLNGMDVSKLYDITFSATAPLPIGTFSNAKTVSGATYTWQANPSSGDMWVDFTTNVLTIPGIILVALILLAIIAAVVVLILKNKKKSAEEVVYDEFGNPIQPTLDDSSEAEAEFYGDISSQVETLEEPKGDNAFSFEPESQEDATVELDETSEDVNEGVDEAEANSDESDE